MITSGYELVTAFTNILLLIVSLFGYIKIKDKSWKLFYLLISIDSFLGVIVHGIVMSKTINDLLWVLLSILFTITINMFLIIFMKFKFKHVIIMSIILSIVMIIQLFLNMNFLLTFVIYIIAIFIMSTYFIIKNNYKNKNIILFGFLVQLIGGILLLCRVSFGLFNYNCICHTFTFLTLIILYIGIQKKD